MTRAITSITSPTGAAYNEDTSTANVTYSGTITQNNAANAVNINAKTGGTTTFAGQVTANTTTADGVDLTSNTGATINFGGGARWFAKSHLAFALDLRYYAIDAQEATDALALTGKVTLMVFSVGVAFK